MKENRPGATSGHSAPAFSPYQKFVVALLAFLQFTIIIDFMILSPLGATLMPALNITPSQFGLVVSIYALSAGVSGLLAAGFADRYDRKSLLMFFYCGFVLGTLFCALAPNYHFLLLARMVTGLFGGVIGAVVSAIVTDLFTLNMRGRVMGALQTAFAASQILGLPTALYLSNLWGWHAPFYLIVAISVIVGFVIWSRLQPIDAHLKLQTERTAFAHLQATVSNRHYLFAFFTTGLLALGGYMLAPFGSAFTVHNLHIPLEKIPLIYLVTGVCTILVGPLVGRASDRYGSLPTFLFGTLVSIIMVFIYTHLQETPMIWVLLVNVLMFVGIFSRMIPSQTLMSALPAPASRGAFMSVNTSMQHISGGIASAVAGLIVSVGPDGHLERFYLVGYVVMGSAAITTVLMYRINKMLRSQTPDGSAPRRPRVAS